MFFGKRSSRKYSNAGPMPSSYQVDLNRLGYDTDSLADTMSTTSSFKGTKPIQPTRQVAEMLDDDNMAWGPPRAKKYSKRWN